MYRRTLWIALLAGLLLGAGPRAESAATGTDYLVVVNDGNPTKAMTSKEISELFLAMEPVWGSGQTARPVDLKSDSPVRRSFSQAVHGRNVTAVKSYWQKMIFSGKGAPPPELEHETEVFRFLAANPSGIGYVSSGTLLPSGIRPLRIH